MAKPQPTSTRQPARNTSPAATAEKVFSAEARGWWGGVVIRKLQWVGGGTGGTALANKTRSPARQAGWGPLLRWRETVTKF